VRKIYELLVQINLKQIHQLTSNQKSIKNSFEGKSIKFCKTQMKTKKKSIISMNNEIHQLKKKSWASGCILNYKF